LGLTSTRLRMSRLVRRFRPRSAGPISCPDVTASPVVSPHICLLVKCRTAFSLSNRPSSPRSLEIAPPLWTCDDSYDLAVRDSAPGVSRRETRLPTLPNDDRRSKRPVGTSPHRRDARWPATWRLRSEQSGELSHEAPIRSAVARLLRVHTPERAWRKGASGERWTGWWLSRLPDGWFVFNDIPVGERRANIDHLVVGPAASSPLTRRT
jgi:hypothetical protein